MQHNIKPYCELKQLLVLCKDFNKLTNNLKRDEHHSTYPDPQWADDDERKKLTDRDIGEINWSGHFVFNSRRKKKS